MVFNLHTGTTLLLDSIGIKDVFPLLFINCNSLFVGAILLSGEEMSFSSVMMYPDSVLSEIFRP